MVRINYCFNEKSTGFVSLSHYLSFSYCSINTRFGHVHLLFLAETDRLYDIYINFKVCYSYILQVHLVSLFTLNKNFYLT